MKTKVLNFVSKIPKGRVTSYKILAEKTSSNPRAVAKILASNQKQIQIPCHRVVNSSGEVGGYNLGKDLKVKLLTSEGVNIRNNKIVDSFFQFDNI